MSTTERARGQILAIFALSLTTLILVAALAFDTGAMLLERRDQQNAADAAALAGARYLPGNTEAARSAAFDVARENGFDDGVGTVEVDVYTPPQSGDFAGMSGFIEVDIRNTRPSIFAGIMGVLNWPVGARAVAANQSGIGASFAMLSLDPHGCEALLVSGNGEVNSGGNIQVNSDCDEGALQRVGNSSITVTASGAACNVVGDIKSQGSGQLICTQNEGAQEVPDPLANLPAPGRPELAPKPVEVSITGQPVPPGCPNSGDPEAATLEEPATCQFPSSYADTEWRLYPGYYPGGLKLQAGTFYLNPGIYYLGGGGFTVVGNGATAISVASGGTSLGGGVLLYNTEAYGFHDECASGTATDAAAQCIQPIDLAGSDANVDLYPLRTGIWGGLVIFQDRTLNIAGNDVVVNGSDSDTQVRGTIYVPSGDVQVNGSGGEVTTDQVIAYRFKIAGSQDSRIDVLYDEGFIFKLSAAGLVE